MADISVAITYDVLTDLSSAKTFPTLDMKQNETTTHTERMPFWLSNGTATENAVFLTEDRRGIIAGTVKILGVLQNKARVNLYYRKSGQLIQSTFTDTNGVFSFACGLNRNVADYYAVAITDQPYNAQVFDKLTPA